MFAEDFVLETGSTTTANHVRFPWLAFDGGRSQAAGGTWSRSPTFRQFLITFLYIFAYVKTLDFYKILDGKLTVAVVATMRNLIRK